MSRTANFINEIQYFVCTKLPSLLIGKIKRNPVYAYWGKYPNFGDQLTPIILKYYGFTPIYSNYNPRFSFSHKAEFVCVIFYILFSQILGTESYRYFMKQFMPIFRKVFK